MADDSTRKRVKLLFTSRLKGPICTELQTDEVTNLVCNRLHRWLGTSKCRLLEELISEDAFKRLRTGVFGASNVATLAGAHTSGQFMTLGWLTVADGDGEPAHLYFSDRGLRMRAVCASCPPECLNSLVLVKRACFVPALCSSSAGQDSCAGLPSPWTSYILEIEAVVPIFTLADAKLLLRDHSPELAPPHAAASGLHLFDTILAISARILYNKQEASLLLVGQQAGQDVLPIICIGPQARCLASFVTPGQVYVLCNVRWAASQQVLRWQGGGTIQIEVPTDESDRSASFPVLELQWPSCLWGTPSSWWESARLPSLPDGQSPTAAGFDAAPFAGAISGTFFRHSQLCLHTTVRSGSHLSAQYHPWRSALASALEQCGAPCLPNSAHTHSVNGAVVAASYGVVLLQPDKSTTLVCVLAPPAYAVHCIPYSARVGCRLQFHGLQSLESGSAHTGTYAIGAWTRCSVLTLSPVPCSLSVGACMTGLSQGSPTAAIVEVPPAWKGLVTASQKSITGLARGLGAAYVAALLIRLFATALVPAEYTPSTAGAQPGSRVLSDRLTLSPLLQAVMKVMDDFSNSEESGGPPSSGGGDAFCIAPPVLFTPAVLSLTSLGIAHTLRGLMADTRNRPSVCPWTRGMDLDPKARASAHKALASDITHRLCDHLGMPATSTCGVRLSEHWWRVTLPLTALASRHSGGMDGMLACRFSVDPCTGYGVAADDIAGVAVAGMHRSARHSFHGASSLSTHPTPPAHSNPKVELHRCETQSGRWVLAVEIVSAPVILSAPATVLQSLLAGAESSTAEVTLPDDRATCTSHSEPFDTGQPQSSIQTRPEWLSTVGQALVHPCIERLEAAGKVVTDGVAERVRKVWADGWTGGWTDLWCGQDQAREMVTMPDGAVQIQTKDDVAVIPFVQARMRFCLQWEGTEASLAPHTCPPQVEIPTAQGLAVPSVPHFDGTDSRPIWLCPVQPPRIRVSRRPLDCAAVFDVESGEYPCFLVNMDALTAGVAVNRQASTTCYAPIERQRVPSLLDPPPTPTISEVANVFVDGRVESKRKDGATMDIGAYRVDSRCKAILPAGIVDVHPGQVLACQVAAPLVRQVMSNGSLLCDGTQLQFDHSPSPPPSRQGVVHPMLASAMLAPLYGPAQAIAQGRSVTWPSHPRLLFSVRGAVSPAAECCTHLTEMKENEDTETGEPVWSIETVTDVTRQGAGQSADTGYTSFVPPSTRGLKSKGAQASTDRRSTQGRSPKLTLIGRILNIRVLAEHSPPVDDRIVCALGAALPADDLYSRWVGVGPCGDAEVKLLLTLQQVDLCTPVTTQAGHGDDAFLFSGETLSVYVRLQDDALGGVLPLGFGPGAVVMVTDCTREYNTARTKAYFYTNEGVLHMLAVASAYPDAVRSLVQRVSVMYTPVDPPAVEHEGPSAVAGGHQLPGRTYRSLRSLALSPLLRTYSLTIRVEVLRCSWFSIGWLCPSTRAKLVPIPQALVPTETGMFERRYLWGFIPAGARVYRTGLPCREGGSHLLIEESTHRSLLKAYSAALEQKGKRSKRNLQALLMAGAPHTSHQHDAMLFMEATMFVSDYTGRAKVHVTDIYAPHDLCACLSPFLPHAPFGGSNAARAVLQPGSAAVAFGFTERQLCYWAFCCAVHGQLVIDSRIATDVSSLLLDAPTAVRGPGLAHTMYSVSTSAPPMFGTWLPADEPGGGGYHPLADTAAMTASYWRVLEGVRLATAESCRRYGAAAVSARRGVAAGECVHVGAEQEPVQGVLSRILDATNKTAATDPLAWFAAARTAGHLEVGSVQRMCKDVGAEVLRAFSKPIRAVGGDDQDVLAAVDAVCLAWLKQQGLLAAGVDVSLWLHAPAFLRSNVTIPAAISGLLRRQVLTKLHGQDVKSTKPRPFWLMQVLPAYPTQSTPFDVALKAPVSGVDGGRGKPRGGDGSKGTGAGGKGKGGTMKRARKEDGDDAALEETAGARVITVHGAGSAAPVARRVQVASREWLWRRDATLRTACPQLSRHIVRSWLMAREVALAACLTAWHDAVDAHASIARTLSAQQLPDQWRRAVSTALAMGSLGFPTLPGNVAPYALARTKVLLPRPPSAPGVAFPTPSSLLAADAKGAAQPHLPTLHFRLLAIMPAGRLSTAAR